jgi:CRISPR-associated endoribonuclease Cas6
MRLHVALQCEREARLPIDHQDVLAAAAYHLLETSDEAYSRWLHDEGFAADSGRNFKLFAFSTLRADSSRRRIAGDRLVLSPGPVEWIVASPKEAFVRHLATGLFQAGSLRVGGATFPVTGLESRACPEFSETSRWTCLTPIVAARSEPGRKTPHYCRPHEEEAFSEAVRNNLLLKYRMAYGGPPRDDRLRLEFDRAYLERRAKRNPETAGTKKVRYKEIEVIGAFAPFALTGSAELMKLAWDCGLGEKNSGGFGMVETREKRAD